MKKMIKLFRLLNSFKLKLGYFFLILISSNSIAQSYHDCTAVDDFNDLIDKNANIEEELATMNLEFSKSLSKFDKCVNQEYLEKEKKQESLAENKEQKEKSELAENKEQKEKSELAENEEQKEKSELAKNEEQKEKSGSAENGGQIENTKKDATALDNYNKDKLYSAASEGENNSYNDESLSKPIVNSVASTELSGTELSIENIEEASNVTESEILDNSELDDFAKEEIIEKEGKNIKIPQDIPQDDNDSVLEKQIKLAAMNEKDPEKKKRLWNEYRKYKGIPKKN